MIHELFARNLKKYRKLAGHTQVKLAKLCGVSVSLIAHIETNGCHASMDLVEKVCIALEIEPVKFFETEKKHFCLENTDMPLIKDSTEFQDKT